MRILACHNYYQHAGGEDRCFEDEATLLEQHGHTVVRYIRNNDHIGGLNAVLTAGSAIWNVKTYREVRSLIRQHQIDLVHCTNTFPLISPSIYYACNRSRVPVVQSLQNYRLLCANSYLLRDGKVCEKCIGQTIPWNAVRYKCYRDDRLASLAVASMQTIHQLAGTWRDRVDQFVVPTEFAKEKFITAGLPGQRISVKPNFVDPAPTIGTGQGGYALFAGRLSKEKGIETLLQAWNAMGVHYPLHIAGDGPLKPMVEAAARLNPSIRYLGFLSADALLDTMREATCLVVPSLWYEGFPRTIVESLSVGTPVLASAIGPLAELIHDEGGGLTFDVGDANSLANRVSYLLQDPACLERLRVFARREFETCYSAQSNYHSLMNIYATATQVSNRRHQGKKPRSLSNPVSLPTPPSKIL